MTVAKEYTSEWLQVHRPQPMYDKKIHQLLNQFLLGGYDGPKEEGLKESFIEHFMRWVLEDPTNRLTGYSEFPRVDICQGCTQFIDSLYMKNGVYGVQILEGDYTYHLRLNPKIEFVTPTTLRPNIPLIVALPFPRTGDIHSEMSKILESCVEKNIDVHIDGAWITCSKDISFDFSHPAIKSFAISLSKGLGLGWSRIAVRWSRDLDETDAITIMNNFNMLCRPDLWVGHYFLTHLEPYYFWKKYEKAYEKVISDFNLRPSKSIHLALKDEYSPVGIRPLLRYLADKSE